MRNPSNARFGNKCAAKKRKQVQEAATQLPVSSFDIANVHNVDDVGLDELADRDEEEEEGGADIEDNLVPTNHSPFNLSGYEALGNIESIDQMKRCSTLCLQSTCHSPSLHGVKMKNIRLAVRM